MAGNEKAPDPKAALQKYTYPGAEQDDAAIKKVETAIAQHFPASYTAGLEQSTANAPIKEDEVHGKMDEAKQKAGSEAANNPDAKKELQEGGTVTPPMHAPVKPAVKDAKVAAAPAAAPKKGGAGGGDHAHGGAGAAGGGKAAKGGGHSAGSAPSEIVSQAASSGEADIDGWLDKYPKKSPEPTEKLSKVKEMAAVAKGFDAQLEKAVDGGGSVDSASAKVVNFLGKKDFQTAFGDNPYAKVEGGLGTIMRGLSRFNAVVTIVGNVCTKLGMVLTVLGLLGMILPPVGAIVSAIARVLNVVGIICDVIGLVLSGILTGLNGVVLAKQIAKGASNEEKAATADLMMSEATSAGGHIVSLAMTYGPGFMKGFKSASKNVLGNLFKKFKTVVGKFAGKALGPVANWAKNIGYKVGIGLEKEAKAESSGLLKKVWNSPGTALEKLRDTKLVKSINNSSAMKSLERGAGKLDKIGWVNKIDGVGESLGKSAGSGAAAFSDRLKKSAEEDAKVIADSVERNAAKNAANREREKIDHDITKQQEIGNNQLADHRNDEGKIPQENIQKSDAAYAKADELEAGKKDAIATAERDEGTEARKEYEDGLKEQKKDEKADEKKEQLEEKRQDEFKRDPKKFQNETAAQQGRLDSVEKKLENPSLTAAEKEKLEHTKASLEKTIADRKMIPLTASGGESFETLGDVIFGKQSKEIRGAAKGIWQNKDGWNWKDEKGEKQEQYAKVAEHLSGHDKHEEDEKNERHEKIGEFAAESVEHSAVAEHVNEMLEGLNEELGMEPDAGDADEGAANEGDEGAANDEGGGANAPSNEEQKQGGGDQEPTKHEPAVAAAAAPAPAPAAAPEEKKENVPDPGELAYWPKLTGEFSSAVKDLHRMKMVAYYFKKQQEEARKKAYEAATTYSKSGEDAEKKAEAAKAHTAGLHGTIDEAKNNTTHAAAGSGQADKGSAEQGKGQGTKGDDQAPPDPGEKPSRWHPIKRIWWYVKKWASEKAAAVMGWIQEKISSLVLQGLCGVSMGDMKAYTEALRHRMEFSKTAGTQGVEAANRAMAEQHKSKGESKSYEQQALDDAAECDQNMADADTFSQSVTQTEQEIVAEQAKAKAFLEQLKAAVAQEKQQQAAERAKKAQEAKVAAAAATGTAPGATAAAATAPKAPTPKPQPAGQPREKKPVSAAATGKVKNAAAFVVTKANSLFETFVDVKGRQSSALKSALGKQPASVQQDFATLQVGDKMVAAFKQQTTSIASSLDTVKSASPTTAKDLHGNAGQVKSSAKQLDEAALQAHEALNEAFKATYKQINDSQVRPSWMSKSPTMHA